MRWGLRVTGVEVTEVEVTEVGGNVGNFQRPEDPWDSSVVHG